LNELVSIITPSYNSHRFIKDTIDSVINQTYQHWEMIIVDDCSTDDSVAFIQSLIANEPRITCRVLEHNIGAAAARNEALKIANGRYIAFLDSDDIWLPQKLETQLQFMRDHNYAFTFTQYLPMSEDARIEFSPIQVPKVLTYSDYCKNTIIGCLTVMIDKKQTGEFYMPLIKSSHDMALWLLIMKRGFNAYGLNTLLAKYRLVATSNTAKKVDAAKDVWRVYCDIESLPIYQCVWYFMHYAINAIKKRL